MVEAWSNGSERVMIETVAVMVVESAARTRLERFVEVCRRGYWLGASELQQRLH
ncbi:hypothetical protein WN943_025404 [Citrus x changshan-huyou]